MKIKRSKHVGVIVLSWILSACGGGSSGDSTPELPLPAQNDIDLRSVDYSDGLIRVFGSDGRGNLGVPVAGGFDVNGDGHNDVAMSALSASPNGQTGAGQVYLALGNSMVNYFLDTSQSSPQLITFEGSSPQEATGSEIWMGDVTGDGLGDVLIARQNMDAQNPARTGAGGLSIVVGTPSLSELAANEDAVTLAESLSDVNVLTITGSQALDRLGIWLRVGDVDGDGIDDIAIGADQADDQGSNSGLAYVIRGGEHLNTTASIDLASVAGTALEGHLAIVKPPSGSQGFHFGATLNLADLDGNNRAELIVAATINRAGASVPALNAPAGSAEASGGFPGGRAFIVWDDNFPDLWPLGFSIVADSQIASGAITDITGGIADDFRTQNFGEEILGGLDYNGDGLADLFIGDITGNTAEDSNAGLGFVFFNAAQLKGQIFSVVNPPQAAVMSTIYGPSGGAISSDTALHGDFDGDSIADLAIASPHASPLQRDSAGAVHVLWGQSVWPEKISLKDALEGSEMSFSITNILGANGTQGSDTGDTLAYSAAAGDIDQDGLIDLIINEMVGNGLASGTIDAGNLIVISGSTLAQEK